MVTVINPKEKGKAVETYAARFRDAKKSFLLYGWTSVIDHARLAAIDKDIAVRIVGSEIHIGPRTATPSGVVGIIDSVAQPGQPHLVDPTWDAVKTAVAAIHHKLVPSALITRPNLDVQLALFQLEETKEYNITVTEQPNHDLLIT